MLKKSIKLIPGPDIEKAKTESAWLLEGQKECFQHIFEGAPIGIALIDKSGEILQSNPRCKEIIGYSSGEIIGKSIKEITHPDDLENCIEKFDQLMVDKINNYQLEQRCKHGRGGYIWVRMNISSVRDNSRRIIYVIAYIEEITTLEAGQRMQDGRIFPVEVDINSLEYTRSSHYPSIINADEKLLSSRQHAQAIIDNAHDAILEMNIHGEIVLWNPQAEKIFGWRVDEVIGRQISEIIIPPVSREAHKQGLKKFLATGKGSVIDKRIEIAALHRDGHEFPVELTVTHIKDGEESSFIGFICDITRQKQNAEILRKTNRALTVLSQCNQALLHAKEEQELLDEICKIVVNTGKLLMVGVGIADYDDEKRVHMVAHHGHENDYLANANVNWRDDNERGRGPVGIAIRTGCPYLTRDMRTDPNFGPWREAAIERGYASNVVLPLITDDQTVGVLLIYSSVPDAFDDDELGILIKLADNLAYGIMAIRTSIERKIAEDELKKNLSLQLAILDSTADGILVVDNNGNIISYNRKFIEIWNVPYSIPKNPSKKQVLRFVKKQLEDSKPLLKKIKKLHSSQDIVSHEPLYFKDGRIIEPYSHPYRLGGDTIGRLWSFRDITESKILSDQLHYHANHDSLTGLINRREFERRLEKILQAIRTEAAEYALCYLDLDQFKVINDNCGHVAGDELLRQLGHMLQQNIRKTDTLARLGGDEFGILMEHCSIEQAERIANNLRKAVERFRFIWDDKNFSVGVSIGLVPITELSGEMTSVLQQADASCYLAKDEGRNRVHIFHEKDEELTKRRGEMEWVTRVNTALEEDMFCLWGQLITPADDSDVSEKFYECLIRMKQDDEIIMPGAFLPAAERYGLSTKIDRWVIKAFCNTMEQHRPLLDRVNLFFINLSGSSLGDKEFLGFLIQCFASARIPLKHICFEITETAAITNFGSAIEFIRTLKEQDCNFALDDFGSGLSSFAYLKNLPVDYLKIDGAFVKDIVEDRIAYSMVKSINEIGKIMGKKTIAESVENEAIEAKLKEIEVTYMQGYSLGRPKPLTEIV